MGSSGPSARRGKTTTGINQFYYIANSFLVKFSELRKPLSCTFRQCVVCKNCGKSKLKDSRSQNTIDNGVRGETNINFKKSELFLPRKGNLSMKIPRACVASKIPKQELKVCAWSLLKKGHICRL